MDQDNTAIAPDEPFVDPAAVGQEVTHSSERTDPLGLAIEQTLDSAERELAEIRRVGIPPILSR